MITVKFNKVHFENQARKLAKIYNRSTFDELRHQAGLILMDCVKMTPPMTFENASKESFAKQKRIGEEAVTRDVRKVFKTPNQMGFFGSSEDVRNVEKHKRFSVNLRKLIRKGDFKAADEMLRRAGLNIKGAIPEATPELHKKERRNGRVPKGQIPWLTNNGASINRIIEARKANVGLGKGGWATACAGLGVKIPNWISKHAVAGGFRQVPGERPSVTCSNNLAFIQKAGSDRRIVERAMNNRMRNIKKEVEHAHAASLRKQGVHAHVK